MEDHEVTQSRARWNGWACPWHPLQCAAWFFIFLFGFLHFGVFGHYILGYWRVLIFVVPGILFIILVVAMVVATSINPAEPAVREKLARGQFYRPKFDRDKFPHVIQDSYCQLCQVNVSGNAKHCRVCDKCILDFDHHCKWLNNCVGSRNYKWFLATVWSAIIGLFLFFLYTLSLFVVYFVGEDASLLRFNCDFPGNLSACNPALQVLGVPLPTGANPVFPALCALFAFLAVVGLGFLLHLAFFHVYLRVKGQSTYEYFVERRNSKSESSGSGTVPRRHWKALSTKANRVTPSEEKTLAHSNAPPDFVAKASLGRGTSLERGPSLEMRTSPSSYHSSDLSEQSCESLGVTTFGRTPPSYECTDDSYDNLTDEQKLLMAQREATRGVGDCRHPPQAALSESDEFLVQALMVPSPKDSSCPPTFPSQASTTTTKVNPSPPLTPPSQIRVYRDSKDKGQSEEEEGGAGGRSQGREEGKRMSGKGCSLLSPQQQQKLAAPGHMTSHHSPSTSSSKGVSSAMDSTSPSEEPDRGTAHSSDPDPSIRSSDSHKNSSDQGQGERGSRESPLPPIHNSSNDTPLPSAATASIIRSPSPLPHIEGGALQKRVSFQQGSRHSEPAMSKGRVRPLPPIGTDDDCDNSPPVKKGRRLPPLPHNSLALHSSSSQQLQFLGSTYSLPLPDYRYSLSPPTTLSPISLPSRNATRGPAGSRAATAGSRRRGRGAGSTGRRQLSADDVASRSPRTVSSVPDILSVNSVSEC